MGTNQSFLLKIDPPDLEFCETKQEDKWRLNFLKEIVNVQNNILNLDQNDQNLYFLKYFTVHLREPVLVWTAIKYIKQLPVTCFQFKITMVK